MNKTSAELKAMARSSLLGNYGTAVGSVLVPYAVLMGIMFVIYIFAIAGTLAAVFTSQGGSMSAVMIILILVWVAVFLICILGEYMIMPGYTKMYLNICRGERCQLGDLLYGFKNTPGKFVLISFALLGIVVVTTGISFLINLATIGIPSFAVKFAAQWGYILILYVLAFVMSLNFGLTYKILVDRPECGIMEALKESSRMMKGNKWRYFRLMLSFLGWVVIGYLSFGLGFLWLIPYIGCTFTEFYLDLKGQQEPVFSPEEMQYFYSQAEEAQFTPVYENPVQGDPSQGAPGQEQAGNPDWEENN